MTVSRLLCISVTAFVAFGSGCSNSGTEGHQMAGGTTGSGGATSSGGTVGSGGKSVTSDSSGGTVGSGGTTASVTGGPGGQTGSGGQSSGGQFALGGTATGGGEPASGGTTSPATQTGGQVASTSGTTGTGGSTTAGDLHAPGNPPIKSTGCGKTPTLKTGTQTITSSSQQRQYIIDIPTDYDNNKAYRLVFGLHWMGGTMTDVATGQTVKKDVWAYFGLKRLDTPRSAIFVAPQGIGNGWANTNGQDTVLLDDIIKTVEDDLCVDKTRIFAGGFSYGGMFSSTLACTRSDVYRALAPQNGSGSCSAPKPVAFFASGSTDGTNQSLQSYARVLAKANGCTDPQQAMPIPTAGSKLHTCTSFTGCPAAYPVRFCAFDEGHKAAPCDGCGPQEDNGDTTWTPGEVWKFYTQF